MCIGLVVRGSCFSVPFPYLFPINLRAVQCYSPVFLLMRSCPPTGKRQKLGGANGLGKEGISSSQKALFMFILDQSGGHPCPGSQHPVGHCDTRIISYDSARQTGLCIIQLHARTPKCHGCWNGRVLITVSLGTSLDPSKGSRVLNVWEAFQYTPGHVFLSVHPSRQETSFAVARNCCWH